RQPLNRTLRPSHRGSPGMYRSRKSTRRVAAHLPSPAAHRPNRLIPIAQPTLSRVTDRRSQVGGNVPQPGLLIFAVNGITSAVAGGIPLNVSHLVYGFDERFEPTIKIEVVLTREHFLFLDRQAGIVDEGRETGL